MKFGKIDFINLLPFYVYMKKNVSSSQAKQMMNYKKSYPAQINILFQRKEIDAAFISSIKSENCSCLDLGIVAKNEVLSVLALNGSYKKDYQSDTSNALAKVLNIQGEILIGDKALYHYHNCDKKDFVDLAKAWKEKYSLPFVFARLCFNGQNKSLNKLAKGFAKSNVKVPYYILNKYSKRSNLSNKQIKDYLTKISYTLGYKEKKSLKLFLKLLKNKGL